MGELMSCGHLYQSSETGLDYTADTIALLSGILVYENVYYVFPHTETAMLKIANKTRLL